MIEDIELLPVDLEAIPTAGSVFVVQISRAQLTVVSISGSHSDRQYITDSVSVDFEGHLAIPVPADAGGKTLCVEALFPGATASGVWTVQPRQNLEDGLDMSPEEIFSLAVANLSKPPYGVTFRRTRTWSYGDVESGGVYYHPNLTHYSHQFFEEFFRERVGLHYADLSRDSDESKRARLVKGIPQMTFPVVWLYQYMKQPMEAGDSYTLLIDTVEIDKYRIAVRAWAISDANSVAAVVIWIRCAVLLPGRSIIAIPDWFPTQPSNAE